MSDRAIAGNARAHKGRPLRSAAAALKGLIFDADGSPMSPTFAQGHTAKSYRYYVSAPLQQGRGQKTDDGAIRRIPGEGIEALVLGRLQVAGVEGSPQRVEVHADSVRIFLRREDVTARYEDSDAALLRLRHQIESTDELGADGNSIRIVVPIRMKLRGGRTWILTSDGRAAGSRGRPSLSLVKGLRTGHRILREHDAHPMDDAASLMASRAPPDSYQRDLAALAFLAPDIQMAILQGREPAGLSLRALRMDAPLAWADQRALLNFDTP